MSMNLHLVRLFEAVATLHSFSRAGEMLHISQPAVSKGVATLERQLGLSLLDRSQPELPLTDAGVILLGYSQALFANERAAELALRQLRGLEQGQLAVGASTTVGIYYLPSFLAEFQRKYPTLRISLEIGNTFDLLQRLVTAPLDLILVEGPVDDPNFHIQPWGDDTLVVIASAQHHSYSSLRIPVPIIAESKLLMRESGSGTRMTIDAHLKLLPFHFTQIMEVGHTEAIKRLVAEGLGFGIVPRIACQAEFASGRLIELDVPELTIRRELSLVEVRGRPKIPTKQAFETLLGVTIQD